MVRGRCGILELFYPYAAETLPFSNAIREKSQANQKQQKQRGAQTVETSHSLTLSQQGVQNPSTV